jgi:hypothetical protein
MCVLISSTILSETFLILRRIQWDMVKNIEILYMSNEMQLFVFFITNDALHVSGVLSPSSGALWTVQCSLW